MFHLYIFILFYFIIFSHNQQSHHIHTWNTYSLGVTLHNIPYNQGTAV